MSSDAAEIVTLLGFKCLQMTHVLVVTTHLSNAATAMRREGGGRWKGGREGRREVEEETERKAIGERGGREGEERGGERQSCILGPGKTVEHDKPSFPFLSSH